MPDTQLYEVWAMEGEGKLVFEAETQDEAEDYCYKHRYEYLLSIRYPSGEWHNWNMF